jgi:carbon-monoxide dehydrogenase large subunit
MTTDTLTSPARFGSGHAVHRMEDDALLAGRGQFTDDLHLDLPQATARLVFLRSPYPHARIVSVDADAARAMPGVLAVWTGADLFAAGVKHLPGTPNFKRADGSPGATAERRPLAHERVRFVGEAVVAIVAETLQQARDAAEAVQVDYDDLPAVTTAADATAPGAPALCDAAPDNISAEARYGDATATEAAFAKATHVVRLNINNQRLAAVTLEPRSVLAWTASDGRLTLRISGQMPTAIRDAICASLPGQTVAKTRVTVGDVGGGFGMKTSPYPEDIALAWCARELGRPVKWIADRSEDFLAATHGRDLVSDAELALAADGKILALRLRSSANVGAYATGTAVVIALMIGPWVTTSVYDIQTIDFHFKAVMSNTAPIGAYRGAGRPEAIYLMERLMDEAARQTGIDRITLRRRNFITPAQMPYKNPMNQLYDTGQFEHVMNQGLAQALGTSGMQGFEARAEESKARGMLRGLGIATFLEWTGGNVFEETVSVDVKADGIVEVFAAVNQMGQGIATTLAQLVVDVFDVPISQVRVVLGDTDRGNGFGSAGSRSIFTGGSSLRIGAERTVEHAKTLAATELEVSAQDMDYAAGRFSVKGTDIGIDLFELASRQAGGQIHMDSTSTVAGPTWPNGCHISEVEIDPQTGSVQVVAYSSVNDVGRVINPMIVRGQLDGGALQGIGQALHEQVVYDVETGQLLTGSLMDYTAPRADDMACEFVTSMDESTPCKNNPLGVKGVGELGTIGATPSIINAVADALARGGRSDLTTKLQMPLTPSRLWALMAVE